MHSTTMLNASVSFPLAASSRCLAGLYRINLQLQTDAYVHADYTELPSQASSRCLASSSSMAFLPSFAGSKL